MPPGTKYARSENGWINTDLFEHWSYICQHWSCMCTCSIAHERMCSVLVWITIVS